MLDLLTVPQLLRERAIREGASWATEGASWAKQVRESTAKIPARNALIRADYKTTKSLRTTANNFAISHELVRRICKQ